MSRDHTHHTQSSEQPPKQRKRRTKEESDIFQIPEKYYEAGRLVAALTEPPAAQRLSVLEVDIINSKAYELETLKDEAQTRFNDEMPSLVAKRAMRYAESKISEKAQELMTSLQGYKDKAEV